MTIWHPEALAELEEGKLFYESRRDGLGNEFAADIRAGVGRIEMMPEAHAPLDDLFRRCLIKRFSYGIIFSHDAGGGASALQSLLANHTDRAEL